MKEKFDLLRRMISSADVELSEGEICKALNIVGEIDRGFTKVRQERELFRAKVEDLLTATGYDGLCNPEVPCGCLKEDLAPCGEICAECRPGKRENVDEHAVCGCDGQGEKHWHVFIPGSVDHSEPSEWVCECGQKCVPNAADWRWNGRQWEHHHGYPIGYVQAQRKA